MWNFFKDCVNLFLLRFQPLTHYRYHWTTMIGVVSALGVIRYATTYMLLGKGAPILVFCIIVDLVSWLVLSATMNITLPRFWGAPKLPTLNFILVTEALILPTLLFIFLSADVNSALSFFLVSWRFWVQVFGLSILSGVSLWKVLISYLVYFLVFSIIMMFILGIFVALGVFDLQEMMTRIQQMQAAGR